MGVTEKQVGMGIDNRVVGKAQAWVILLGSCLLIAVQNGLFRYFKKDTTGQCPRTR